jgi:tetratricopeptide (TPR) repeat protein
VKSRVVLLLLLAGLPACAQEDPDSGARRHTAAGDQHFAAGKYPEAIVEYRVAIQAQPRVGETRRKLADAYRKNGDERQSIGEYIRAADLLPNDIDLQIRAGEALIIGERFEDAQARVDPILKTNPHNIGAQLVRANALAGLRDLEGGIEELESIIQREPLRTEPYLNLGVFRLAQGDRVKAEAEFKKAVTLAPQSIAAHLALAHFYFSTERPSDAINAIRVALSYEPKHELANRTMAAFLTVSGRGAEAAPYLRTAAEVSNSRDAWLRLADTYVMLQKTDEAVATLNTLLGRADAFALAKVRLAKIELNRDHPIEAQRHIEDVLTRDPGNVPAQIAKARLMLSQKDRRGAVQLMSELVKKNPEDPEVYFTLGVAYYESQRWTPALEAFSEVIRRDPRSVQAHAYMGRVELARRDATAAIHAANQAMVVRKDNADAHAVLVRGLIMQKDFAQAASALDRWAARSGPSTEIESLRATLLLAKQKPQDARAAYDRALKIDPGNVEARAGLVEIALATGRPNDARTAAAAAVKRDPDSASAQMLAARTALRLGDTATAEKSLRRAIELDENTLDAYGLLGAIYVKESRLDEARKEFEQIAQRQTRPISAYTLIGTVLEAQRKPKEAEEAYLKALEIDPRAAVAANNLAWMYAIGQRQLDSALSLARTAKEELSDNAHVDDTLGWVQYQREKYAEAIVSLSESVRQKPANAAYRFRLGMAHYRAGDLQAARGELSRALQLSTDFEGALEARRVLELLGK